MMWHYDIIIYFCYQLQLSFKADVWNKVFQKLQIHFLQSDFDLEDSLVSVQCQMNMLGRGLVDEQVSISPSFYAHLLCTYFWAKKIQSQNITKTAQSTVVQKIEHKLLIKLTTAVNFTNILQTASLYRSVILSSFQLTIHVCIFMAKEIGKKAKKNFAR